jgi:hypothetical protein
LLGRFLVLFVVLVVLLRGLLDGGVFVLTAELGRLFARGVGALGSFSRVVVGWGVVGGGSSFGLVQCVMMVGALNMNVATYPEDMLIALSDLLIRFEEDVVNGKLLLEK